MQLNAGGLDLIRCYEGRRLSAYQDAGGKWTIGYGHTRGVKEGDICTEDQANQWFEEDINEFSRLVLACISVQLTDNQFSALVSFAYNVGLGYKGIKDGFKVLRDGSQSTLLTLINSRQFTLAAEEFPRWCKIDGVPNAGVLSRRCAEKALFLQPGS